MQNLPLPFMAVQEMFYLRKLWYYVLNIQDQQTKKSVYYTYPEETANRGPHEVSSFILKLINQYVPNTVEHLPTRFQQFEWGPKSRPDYDQATAGTNNEWPF